VAELVSSHLIYFINVRRQDSTMLLSDRILGLGEICEANDDCVILNSVCDKKVCSCAKNYYQLDGQCWAGNV